MRTRVPAFLFLAASALALTSCSASNGAALASATAKGAQTATVERANIIGVLTVKGVVVQGAAFQLHTSVVGTVAAVGTGSVTVAPSDGSSPVAVSPLVGRLDRPLVSVGDATVPGMAVAVGTATGFTVKAELQSADLLRFVASPLGARAQVDGGHGPFDCPLVDAVPTVDTTGDVTGDSATLLCAVPHGVRVLAGMPTTVVIQLEKALNALVLPVEAVAGTVDSGSVYRRGRDGQPIETPVKLGTTDGVRIVVTDGVKAGDVVFVPGPWLGKTHG